MKKYLVILISSILAGLCIGIGVAIFLTLSPDNKILGATLFGLGLFTIIHFGLYLYTGKIGFVLERKPAYLIDMMVCLLGNLLGVILMSLFIKITRIAPNIIQESQKIVSIKINDNWYSILLLSIMCGIMIYIAVKGHEICSYDFGKIIFVFVPIIIFILCGFEHCVANAAYFTFASVFNLKVFLYFILMIIGNGIGAVLFDGCLKAINWLKNSIH